MSDSATRGRSRARPRRTIYLSKLPRLEKKVRVALDWTLDLVFRKDFVQCLTPPGRAMSTQQEPHLMFEEPRPGRRPWQGMTLRFGPFGSMKHNGLMTTLYRVDDRSLLTAVLGGEGIFLGAAAILDGLTADQAHAKPHNLPHSIAEIVAHMATTRWDNDLVATVQSQR